MTDPKLAVVVLAAGKGTRMKSRLPKVLHPACGKPLVAWPVEVARALTAERTVVVLGHGKDDVEKELRARFPDVTIAEQTEQKGTGHAAQVALPALAGFTGTVVILYGDCPLVTEANVRALVQHAKGRPLALWTTTLADPTGYGRVVRAGGKLTGIVEHKDASAEQRAITEVNPGVYAVDAAFLRTALAGLKNDNAQGEYYLTDVVKAAVAAGHDVPTLAVPFEETLGVNDRVQLAQASALLQRRILERAMLGGVTFVQPGSCVVDDSVRFGTDVVIGPHVQLTGKTRIGDGVKIHAGCVVHDSTLGDDVVLHPYTLCDGAHVDEAALVGPFARLRPGAHLEEGAHVGNFVELKKTRLGKGSKANHLAYLGDADIGAGCNIGAGTITCNYDGIGKHPTVLGDDVFIGSNATLVAPLEIKNGAYVAAASVITREVPPDALAIGRAKQENKEGYAAKVRARNAARAGKKR